MTKIELKSTLGNPLIQLAVLVLIPFSLLFTYFPNEGLIARQRVQLFPALLVLFAMPILQRKAQRASRNAQGEKSTAKREGLSGKLTPDESPAGCS